MFALLVAIGCAGGSVSGEPFRRDILTQEQVMQTGSTNAYDAVVILRANWLVAKGIDSFRTPGEVQVYFNDTRLGGVATLRRISAADIGQIQYFDGIQASGRWGLNHGHGVIFVVSLPPR
jgi:hypothetical protein